MRNKRRVLSERSQQFATEMAADQSERIVEGVRRFQDDMDLKERRMARQCKYCYYLRGARIGGAAMTDWACGICAREALAGSTATPAICDACADEHRLCVECGADRDLKTRRKEWATPKEARDDG